MTTTPDDDGRSMRERMLAGDLYRGADDELVAEMAQAMRLTKRYNDSDPEDAEGRAAILSELLGEVGDEVDIRPPLHCDYGSHIRVGSRTFINFGLMALDVAPITIGEDVLMGPNVQLLTPTHPIAPEPRRAKWEAALPITIGDNVWIGGMAVICPGVTSARTPSSGLGRSSRRTSPQAWLRSAIPRGWSAQFTTSNRASSGSAGALKVGTRCRGFTLADAGCRRTPGAGKVRTT